MGRAPNLRTGAELSNCVWSLNLHAGPFISMRNNSLSRIGPLRWQSWLHTQQTRSHATQEVPDSQRILSEPQLQEENRSFIQPIEAIARPLEIAERPLMVSDVDSPSPPIKKFSSTSIRRHTSTFITEQPSTLITKHNLSPVRKVSYQQRVQPRLEESPKLVQWRVPEVRKPAVQGQYSTSENRLFTGMSKPNKSPTAIQKHS